jgi:hypothetical protein
MIRAHTRRALALLVVEPGVAAAEWDRYVASTRNSLRVLSEATGGFAVVNDFVAGLQGMKRVMRE